MSHYQEAAATIDGAFDISADNQFDKQGNVLNDVDSIWCESFPSTGSYHSKLPYQQMLQLYKFQPTCKIRRLDIHCNPNFQSQVSIALHKTCLLTVTKIKDQRWLYVSSGNEFSGWVYYTDELKNQKALHPVQSFRKYENWKGNNVFLCDGTVMMGNDWLCFGGTLGFFIGLSCLFFAFVPKIYIEVLYLRVSNIQAVLSLFSTLLGVCYFCSYF